MLQPYKDRAQRMTDGIHAESRMLGDVKFHSYQGIEASVGKMERRCGRYDLAEETQTVAALLAYERPVSEPTPRSAFRLAFLDSEHPLVSIQPLGSRPPFFCAHAVGGSVFSASLSPVV